MAKKELSFSDQLRQAIVDRIDSGESRYRIALESRVNHTTLNRFTDSKSPKPITSDNIDRLVAYLGLELKKRK